MTAPTQRKRFRSESRFYMVVVTYVVFDVCMPPG